MDKIPEITESGEITQPAIGLLNDILTDGKVTVWGQELNLNNVLIITTMNFSPSEISYYANEVLKQPKSYYDFSPDDFKAFDDWLSNTPGARYAVLSRLFRTNTVSRLAPNTSIFKPLTREDYAKITLSNIQSSIARISQDGKGANRITPSFSDAFVDYLNNLTMVPSSGARETVFRVDRLTDQLIGFAAKFQDSQSKNTLDLPRKVHLDVKDGKVLVTVTPQKIKGKEMIDLDPFSFEVAYRPDVRLFDRPTLIQAQAPPVKAPANREKPITRKQILASRFPKSAAQTKGLAKKLDQSVIGQNMASQYIESEMNKYMGRTGPAQKEPSFTFIAGFPGIGKSMIVNQTAETLGLPVVRIGMQQFTGDSIDAVNQFVSELSEKIRSVRAQAPGGKFILLIEEIDKIYEVNPQNGAIVNRPVMGMIKDLLAEGQLNVKVQQGGNYFEQKTIDIRDAYTFVTMNFGADLFGFKADPRMTSAQDMLNTWARLSTRPADLKNVLGKLFLPETISRVISNFVIMKPLALKDYAKLIDGVVAQTYSERLLDGDGNFASQINIQLSAEYKRYLLNETVIPSEGARYTSLKSRSMVLYDIEHALNQIKRNSKFATSPFILTLDYLPKSEAIVYRMKNPKTGQTETLGKRKITLTFPRPEANGYLGSFRSLVSVHEFGHAYAAIRTGLRFELATVIPPETGTGGYVKFLDNGMSARAQVARLYSALAARVMERIFFSPNPQSAESVLDVSTGASGDIQQATKQLYQIIYELGFDPNGGTISRVGPTSQPYAKFEDLPAWQIDALGKIMRRMENQIMNDFLSAHDVAWYREKIGEFGRAGTLYEEAFYQLIGYPYPGEGSGFLGDNSTIQETLKGVIDPSNPVAKAARRYLQGNTRTTAKENMDRYLEAFMQALQEELHTMNCNTLLGGAK